MHGAHGLACSERRAGLSIHIIYILCRRASGMLDSERRAWRSIHSYIPCKELLACWAVSRLLLGSRQAVGCLAASGGPGKGRATGGEPRAGQWAGCRCAWRQAACWAVGGRLAGLASGVLGSGRAAGVLGSKRRAGSGVKKLL